MSKNELHAGAAEAAPRKICMLCDWAIPEPKRLQTYCRKKKATVDPEDSCPDWRDEWPKPNTKKGGYYTMSHYTDEHGAPCDYNPRLRGGPGSTGEALFRTCLLEIGLVIEDHLRRIAAALEIPPEELDEIERKAEDRSHDRHTA